jgi:SAM-dependent methyltransferase
VNAGQAQGLIQRPAWSFKSAMRRFSGSLQRVLVPGLRNSQYKYREVLAASISKETDWLDLGCGHQLLPEWMPEWESQEAEMMTAAKSVTGIDLDQSAIRRHKHIQRRVVGDLHRLPFEDSSFSLITANMVMEHVADPAVLLAEAHRVLRPDGIFLFHTPNFLSYGTFFAAGLPQSWKNKLALLLQGRHEEDVYPTFYRINTRKTIGQLAVEAGFNLHSLRMVESSAQTAVLGPLAAFELLLIRMLRFRLLENYRTNVIAIFKKSA